MRIFGPLEARLQSVDRLVLGGLVEGVWPPETRGDPWLSRPMRHELGLDLPERRIGLSAHDFAQALGAPRGHPHAAPPSSPARRRWPRASCSGSPRSRAKSAGTRRWRAARTISTLARALDEPAAPKAADTARADAAARRAAAPPERHRDRGPGCAIPTRSTPGTCSGCAPLDAIDTAARRARPRHRHPRRDRRFHEDVSDALPDDPMRALIEIGEQHFAALRISRGARVLVAALPAHRAAGSPTSKPDAARSSHARRRDRRHASTSRSANDGFTLRRAPTASKPARTAATPSSTTRPARRRPRRRCAPACRRSSRSKPRSCAPGGFEDIPAGASVARIALRAAARRRPPGEEMPIEFEGRHARRAGRPRARQADQARWREFADPTKPYRSLLRPMWKRRTTATTIISRACKEWSLTGGADERWRRRMTRARAHPASRSSRGRSRRPIPAVSAWVSANAGSGKTHVLAQRVIRLLLAGVDPARILCLTFTKAAAANMANRVFDDARAPGRALDDAALDEAMREIGVKPIDATQRARARRLFALALETPGGLKVQTIHAFCTRLLQQFPFEANVAGALRGARRDHRDAAARRARASTCCSRRREAPDSAARPRAGAAPCSLPPTSRSRTCCARRSASATRSRAGSSTPAASTRRWRSCRGALGVEADETRGAGRSSRSSTAPHLPPREWARGRPPRWRAARRPTRSTARACTRWRRLRAAPSGIEAYLDIFCTDDGEQAAERIATKALRKRSSPTSASGLTDERDRVWTLLLRKRAIAAATAAPRCSPSRNAVIARYRAEKDRRGLLDYDDLIDKTLDLLRPTIAPPGCTTSSTAASITC